jgi:hypothetical protein
MRCFFDPRRWRALRRSAAVETRLCLLTDRAEAAFFFFLFAWLTELLLE